MARVTVWYFVLNLIIGGVVALAAASEKNGQKDNYYVFHRLTSTIDALY